MIIEYLGHASFRLQFKTASLVTDPFDPEMVGLKFPKVTSEIVTLSHGHKDHSRADLIEGAKKIVDGPGEYEIEGISIIGVQTYHDDVKGAKRGKNTIYVFESEDLRLAHLGDLGHKLEEKQLDSLGDINILMVPVGGVYTIDAQEASEVAKAIAPNIVIPMHYKVPGMKDSFAELTDYEPFVSTMGIKVIKEEKFSVKVSDLNDDDQVVVILESK